MEQTTNNKQQTILDFLKEKYLGKTFKDVFYSDSLKMRLQLICKKDIENISNHMDHRFALDALNVPYHKDHMHITPENLPYKALNLEERKECIGNLSFNEILDTLVNLRNKFEENSMSSLSHSINKFINSLYLDLQITDDIMNDQKKYQKIMNDNLEKLLNNSNISISYYGDFYHSASLDVDQIDEIIAREVTLLDQ